MLQLLLEMKRMQNLCEIHCPLGMNDSFKWHRFFSILNFKYWKTFKQNSSIYFFFGLTNLFRIYLSNTWIKWYICDRSFFGQCNIQSYCLRINFFKEHFYCMLIVSAWKYSWYLFCVWIKVNMCVSLVYFCYHVKENKFLTTHRSKTLLFHFDNWTKSINSLNFAK